jgi:hypothetical protein
VPSSSASTTLHFLIHIHSFVSPEGPIAVILTDSQLTLRRRPVRRPRRSGTHFPLGSRASKCMQ